MKKHGIIALLLLMAMLLEILPLSQMAAAADMSPEASAEEVTEEASPDGSWIVTASEDASVVDSGTCGDNLTWVLDSDGVLTISGEGEMTENPWYDNRRLIKSIVIEDGVASICDFAFEYCTSLSSVTIPNSVTSIGNYAFYYCTGLTSITIPDSVTSIGNDAFCCCTGLTGVTVPDSVTSIGNYAFFNCTSLPAIHVDSNNANYCS
ncbi:MAG: leucine-rich repeat domain-containing protein, partial [Firmicutes bacterium]|nr:leucine-rich repeat domain-containing protein [Bacillota bacterium]